MLYAFRHNNTSFTMHKQDKCLDLLLLPASADGGACCNYENKQCILQWWSFTVARVTFTELQTSSISAFELTFWVHFRFTANSSFVFRSCNLWIIMRLLSSTLRQTHSEYFPGSLLAICIRELCTLDMRRHFILLFWNVRDGESFEYSTLPW